MSPHDVEQAPPVEVPAELLSADALDELIQAFVLREGTDYGAREADHETKNRQVRKQIESGSVRIVFDPNTESVTVLKKEELAELLALAARGGKRPEPRVLD